MSSEGTGRTERAAADSRILPAIGVLPATRRQRVRKMVWIAVWMVFLGGPVQDLTSGGHSAAVTAAAATAFALFGAVYVVLIFRHTTFPLPAGAVRAMVGVMFGLACVLSATMGDVWIVLFVYVTVAAGAVLPERAATGTVAALVLAIAVIGTDFGRHLESDVWVSFVIPAALAGTAMISARKTARAMRELRAARATVAQLAANEERLRLARDLHDLLGHSLSLITLKSELAGRMLPGRPEQAAAQVADIERVSRQALVDVREAVGGYRRPTLAAELAGARTALMAAGIAADVPQPGEDGQDGHGGLDGTVAGVRLDPEPEAALAWALREAVTNVVRHSDASRCAVVLTLQADATACLTVTDNGAGPSDSAEGNGLTGLRERLALVEGVLETAPGVRGGFTLRATVPVRAEAPAQ
ncbi:sensor histidine kinase [Streptomyces albiaxialis]|uniref:Sensor histidine kinase n=1 Tax=Streptomyces albiaxialis TaxID=329523 RepID=A0ABP5HJX3_9ACTN